MPNVHLTDPTDQPATLEQRYEALIDHYLDAVKQLERVRLTLIRFADAPLTISACQPVLDLAQELRTADLALDLRVTRRTRPVQPLGASLNAWRRPTLELAQRPPEEDGGDE